MTVARAVTVRPDSMIPTDSDSDGGGRGSGSESEAESSPATHWQTRTPSHWQTAAAAAAVPLRPWPWPPQAEARRAGGVTDSDARAGSSFSAPAVTRTMNRGSGGSESVTVITECGSDGGLPPPAGPGQSRCPYSGCPTVTQAAGHCDGVTGTRRGGSAGGRGRCGPDRRGPRRRGPPTAVRRHQAAQPESPPDPGRGSGSGRSGWPPAALAASGACRRAGGGRPVTVTLPPAGAPATAAAVGTEGGGRGCRGGGWA